MFFCRRCFLLCTCALLFFALETPMRSISKSRILALLLLVLGAPFVAPASLTTPAFAQEEVLSEELQQALQQILQGDPLVVAQRLQALVDTNPDQASLILDRALEQASGFTWAAVSTVVRSRMLTQVPQSLGIGFEPLAVGVYPPVGGQFLMWQNNLPYALNVRTEQEPQAAGARRWHRERRGAVRTGSRGSSAGWRVIRATRWRAPLPRAPSSIRRAAPSRWPSIRPSGWWPRCDGVRPATTCRRPRGPAYTGRRQAGRLRVLLRLERARGRLMRACASPRPVRCRAAGCPPGAGQTGRWSPRRRSG